MVLMARSTDFSDVLGPDSSQGVSSTPAPDVIRVASGAGKETAIAGEAYEGASRFSRELALWQPGNRTADQDILPAKRLSDARIRNILQNDAYAQNGQRLHQDNIVGSQFLLNAKPNSQVLMGKLDEKWEDEFQEEVEEKFGLWAESDANYIDSTRRNSFTMLVRQAVGTYLMCGEVLAAVDWDRSAKSDRPFSTSIRMIDVDRLSTPMDKLANAFIIGGVEVNQDHVPTHYHIRKANPRDVYLTQAYQWERLPAKLWWGRPQFIHLFEQMRPNQTRGMSDMAAGIRETHMARQFRDVALQNAVVQATYAAVVESDLPAQDIFARLMASDTDADTAIKQGLGQHLEVMSAFMAAADQLKLNGVRIPALPLGSKLKMQSPGQGAPLGMEFEQSILRNIAALLGVSYEQLSKDYTETNYSSARAAMTETWKFMVGRKKVVADRFANIVYRLWLEEAINKGVIKSLPKRMGSDSAWLYAPLAMEAITACEWIGAARGQIDPLKETQSSVLLIKHKLSTYERELARIHGSDWRRELRQVAREKKEFEHYDLTYIDDVQDNTVNAASGEKNVSEAAKHDFSDILGSENGTLANDFMDAVHPDPDKRGRDAK
ncbi:phage portal protein [Agrobacterium tumefaciens]|uniref:Phage portal protein n=1 Tax=Agrobacterium tumefaciens TaxID=358 RepID=A0AAJ4T8X3_AGRTU|nr:phage portal protein [Agrobacterium tumefaciens]